MPRLNKILIIIAVVGLIEFNSPTKLSLAHSGHQHNSPKPEGSQGNSKQHQEIDQEIEQQSKPSTISPPEVSPVSEISTIKSSNQFSLISYSAELLFLLMLANPFLLYLIKRRISNH